MGSHGGDDGDVQYNKMVNVSLWIWWWLVLAVL